MEIQVVRLFRFDGDGPVKAEVDIMLDNDLAIKGFNVVSSKNGLRVGMPCRQGKDGRMYVMVVCDNDTVKEALESAIIRAYECEE